MGHGNRRQRLRGPQDAPIDARDALQKLRQGRLRAERLPLARKKDDLLRSDQLLQRPSTLVPPAVPEVFFPVGRRRTDVGEECEAGVGDAVPGKHRVDGLRQLGRACLVDTTGVNPDVAVAITARDLACFPDLLRQPRVMIPYGDTDEGEETGEPGSDERKDEGPQ